MTKKYFYYTTVTIGDTNVLQNMYFLNHFKLTGVARELWLRDHVPDALHAIRQGIVLITREAYCVFRKDFYLYDPIRLELWFENARNTAIDLQFAFFHNEMNDLHAEAWQTIVVVGPDHRPCRMPEMFRTACAAFTKVSVEGAVS